MSPPREAARDCTLPADALVVFGITGDLIDVWRY
jgi:hypothetical protein